MAESIATLAACRASRRWTHSIRPCVGLGMRRDVSHIDGRHRLAARSRSYSHIPPLVSMQLSHPRGTLTRPRTRHKPGRHRHRSARRRSRGSTMGTDARIPGRLCRLSSNPDAVLWAVLVTAGPPWWRIHRRPDATHQQRPHLGLRTAPPARRRRTGDPDPYAATGGPPSAPVTTHRHGRPSSARAPARVGPHTRTSDEMDTTTRFNATG